MYVIIVGSGDLGYYLASDLMDKGHEVTIIDKDENVCQRVHERLGCMAIAGFGVDPAVLEEAGLKRADAIVACTPSDEDNLVICHLAELLKPEVRSIATVHNPKNDVIFRELGIDAIVDTTTTLGHVIEYQLRSGELVPLLELKRGAMQIVEAEITEDAACKGKLLQELDLPRGTLIITIIRGDELIVPHGGTEIEVGDVLIAAAESDKIDALRRTVFGR